MSEIEHFMPLLMQREEEGTLAPLLSHGRVHFLWIKHSNLYCIQLQVGPVGTWDSGSIGSCTAHEWGLRLGRGWRWAEMGEVVRDRVGLRVCAQFELFQNGTFSLTLLPTVVATTLKNANASLVYSFLYKTVEVGPGF